jgi:hypothetical protein
MKAPPAPDAIDLSQYRKVLPNRLSRSQALVDDDSILIISHDWLTERICKLALRDIFGITIMPTRMGRIGNVLLAVAALSVLLIGLVSIETGDFAGLIAASVVASLLLLFALINTLLGPTCRCYLRTAVQNANVPSATRLKYAHKLAAKLTSAVRVAQTHKLDELQSRATAANTAPPDETDPAPTPEDAAL